MFYVNFWNNSISNSKNNHIFEVQLKLLRICFNLAWLNTYKMYMND